MDNDDPDIGPPYPRKCRFTVPQVLIFAKQFARLRFELTENPKLFEQTKMNGNSKRRIENLLFDEKLLRAQLLINRNKISDRLLLRALNRFLTKVKSEKIKIRYDLWFTLNVDENK